MLGHLSHSSTLVLGSARRSAWERWTRELSSGSTFDAWLCACKEYGLLWILDDSSMRSGELSVVVEASITPDRMGFSVFVREFDSSLGHDGAYCMVAFTSHCI